MCCCFLQVINRAIIETEEHLRSQVGNMAKEFETKVVDKVEQRQLELHRDLLGQMGALRRADDMSQPRFRETGQAAVKKNQLVSPNQVGVLKVMTPRSLGADSNRAEKPRSPFASVEYRYSKPSNGAAPGSSTISVSFVCKGVPAYSFGHAAKRKIASAIASQLGLNSNSLPPASATPLDTSSQALPLVPRVFAPKSTQPRFRSVRSNVIESGDEASQSELIELQASLLRPPRGGAPPRSRRSRSAVSSTTAPPPSTATTSDSEEATTTALVGETATTVTEAATTMTETATTVAEAATTTSETTSSVSTSSVATLATSAVEDSTTAREASSTDAVLDETATTTLDVTTPLDITDDSFNESATTSAMEEDLAASGGHQAPVGWASSVNPHLLNSGRVRSLRSRVGIRSDNDANINSDTVSKATVSPRSSEEVATNTWSVIVQDIKLSDTDTAPEQLLDDHFPVSNGKTFTPAMEAAILNATKCTSTQLYVAPTVVKYIDGGESAQADDSVTTTPPTAEPTTSPQFPRFRERARSTPSVPSYGYAETDSLPPDEWGKVFPSCGNGKRQSPVAIRTHSTSSHETNVFDMATVTMGPVGNIRLFYPPLAGAAIRRVQHSLFVDVPASLRATLTLAGPFLADMSKHDPDSFGFMPESSQSYLLRGVYFHAPGEHAIDSEPAALEIHLVHEFADAGKESAPKYLIVAVQGKPGAENEAFRNVISTMGNLPARSSVGGLLERYAPVELTALLLVLLKQIVTERPFVPVRAASWSETTNRHWHWTARCLGPLDQ